jgi:hypothetical protein
MIAHWVGGDAQPRILLKSTQQRIDFFRQIADQE